MIRRRREDGLAPKDYWIPFASSPFRLLDEMDRMFDDLRTGFENFLITPRSWEAEPLRTPAIDLIDEGKNYLLQVEMPGIRKEDVSIEVTENDVEVSAETKRETKEEDKEKGYVRRERRYSRFYRKVPLPQQIDSEKVVAELKEGVLSVRLPKVSVPETKVKKVEVK